MLTLFVLALAEPLPGPSEPPALPDELPYVEPANLRDARPSVAFGVAVSMGAWSWDDRWIAAATFALEVHAKFRRVELVISPHGTLYVHRAPVGFLGFEAQLVVAIAENLAVGFGTEQVIEVSRLETGTMRIGPSLKPIIARSGPHTLCLQLVWLALALNPRGPLNAPLPYYTLGYGYLF